MASVRNIALASMAAVAVRAARSNCFTLEGFLPDDGTPLRMVKIVPGSNSLYNMGFTSNEPTASIFGLDGGALIDYSGGDRVAAFGSSSGYDLIRFDQGASQAISCSLDEWEVLSCTAQGNSGANILTYCPDVQVVALATSQQQAAHNCKDLQLVAEVATCPPPSTTTSSSTTSSASSTTTSSTSTSTSTTVTTSSSSSSTSSTASSSTVSSTTSSTTSSSTTSSTVSSTTSSTASSTASTSTSSATTTTSSSSSSSTTTATSATSSNTASTSTTSTGSTTTGSSTTNSTLTSSSTSSATSSQTTGTNSYAATSSSTSSATATASYTRKCHRKSRITSSATAYPTA